MGTSSNKPAYTVTKGTGNGNYGISFNNNVQVTGAIFTNPISNRDNKGDMDKAVKLLNKAHEFMTSRNIAKLIVSVQTPNSVKPQQTVVLTSKGYEWVSIQDTELLRTTPNYDAYLQQTGKA